jgi:hypothetical protein
MARTKKPKKQIVREKLSRYEESKALGRIQNMGGHLIDPPDQCEYKRLADDGAIWTDFGCCQACCGNHCERYKRFLKMSPVLRRRDQRKRGVNLPIHPDDPDHPEYQKRMEEKAKAKAIQQKKKEKQNESG